MNCYISSGSGTGTDGSTYIGSDSQLKNPSSYVHFADNWAGFAKTAADDNRAYCLGFNSALASVGNYGAHAKGRNSCFLDGHVEAQTSFQYISQTSAENIWDATENGGTLTQVDRY